MITELNSASFDEAIKSEQPSVVDFWAVWCMPCKIFAPVVEDISNRLDGKADFYKVNVDDNNDLAVRYSITSIPTLLVFKGGNLVGRLEGVRAKEEVQELIEQNM